MVDDDDSDLPTQNEFAPDGPSSGGPRKTRVGADDNDDELLRLLKRAIRKAQRETGVNPSINQLAVLLKITASEVSRLIQTYLPGFVPSQISSTGNSSWTKHGYQLKAGQNVLCKVVQKEPGGYSVIIPKYNLRGFLPTEATLNKGDELLAQYVCFHNNRVLLSARMSSITSSTELKAVPHFHASKTDDNETPVKLRRATDLIPPPIDRANQPNRMRIGRPDDLLWLLKDIEIGKRTGCVKAFCQEKLSRAALILYRGRAVGCVYGSKMLSDIPNVEVALQNMLADCKTPDTSLVMYGLPESVVLALSAMFLGYTVERSDNLDARSYLDYMLLWLEQKRTTACFAFIVPQSSATVLAYVHEGKYVGAYCVETQDYSADKNMVYDFLSAAHGTRAELSVLPVELSSSEGTIGFSLT